MHPIVIVAPFRQMATLSKQVCQDLNLKLPIVIATDEQAIRAVQEYKDTSIFISRGGTAETLSFYSNKTVVNLTANFDDICLALSELIALGCKNIAVVTRHNIIGYSNSNYTLGNTNISFFPCKTFEDIEFYVKKAVDDFNADGIAGCAVAQSIAKKYNLKSSLIHASYATIKKGIIEAEQIYKDNLSHSNLIKKLHTLLDNIEEGAIIFNDQLEAILFNDEASRILGDVEFSLWTLQFKKHILSSPPGMSVLSLSNKTLIVKVKHITQDDGSLNYILIFQDGSVVDQTSKELRYALYNKGLYAKTTFEDMCYFNNNMKQVVELAKKFAKSDSNILIYGETGVGKEVFAQSIHNASFRKKRPFVSVNCATLSKELAASELFGYVEGAFTGARKQGKQGLFELAQGGTIFLDEITELPLEVQSQLLRVLQERELRRIGDDKVIPLDIRVICASNEDIASLCHQGKFRFDLYYRIFVLILNIPSLKERRDEIIPLFLNFVASFLKVPISKIKYDCRIEQLFNSYAFNGNVRELKNLAEYVSFYGNNISYDVVYNRLYPSHINKKTESTLNDNYFVVPKTISFKELEQAYYKMLFDTYSLAEAQKVSGVSRTSLWRKQSQLMAKQDSDE